MTRTAWMLLCLLACAAPAARAGQIYGAQVEAHQPGRNDQPLANIAAMPEKLIQPGIKGLIKDGNVFLLTRALVLHTDAALVERLVDTSGRGSLVIADGRRVGQRPRSRHWHHALALASALAVHQSVEAQRTAGLWFEAVCTLFQQRGEIGLLDDFTRQGLELRPADPRLQLARGILHQTYADGRVQRFVNLPDQAAVVVMTAPEPGQELSYVNGTRAVVTSFGPLRTAQELGLAATNFRRALEFEPALVEARIRLAHVLSDHGEYAEAAGLARTALETRLSPFFEIYAALVLGRSEVRLGHLEEARAAFDRAAARAPEAQAPRVGLAQVALAEGRPSAGLAELTKVTDPARVRATDDEWTVYFKVHEPDASTLMRGLRDRAR